MWHFRVTSFIVLLLICTLIAQSVNAVSAWNTQTLNQNGAGLGEIAIDSAGNVHILYGEYENGDYHNPVDLIYSTQTGSSWDYQVVAKDVFIQDFKLDLNNNPHIVYRSSATGLKYASWTLGSVLTSFKLIDQEGRAGALALDSSGNPHIAYTANGQALPVVLNYAVWTGSTWDIQTVDNTSRTIEDTVYLTIDLHGNPQILYGYQSPGNGNAQTTIKLATLSSSGWNVQTVVTNALDGAYRNMVLDSKGLPHFTYVKADPTRTFNNGVLNYISWNGTMWNSQIIASNINWGFGAAYLALDSHDNPHVNYHLQGSDSSIGDLVYAEWNGSVWSSQTIDPNSTDAGPIVIDSNGNPHIIYRGQPTPGDRVIPLMYATALGNLPTGTPSSVLTVWLPLLLLVLVVLIAVLIVVVYVLIRKKGKI
jgi:hypothetical protein